MTFIMYKHLLMSSKIKKKKTINKRKRNEREIRKTIKEKEMREKLEKETKVQNKK